MKIHLGRWEKAIFKTPYLDHFKGRKFVFHHLQKCGGTSLKRSLEDYFILKKDYTIDGDPPLSFHQLSSFDLLVGHFEMEDTKLFNRYPEVEDPNVFLFTMVREPLKLKISLYYYWLNRGKIRDINLIDFLGSRRNYLANLLYCDQDNWKAMLNKYSFIGVLENYAASLQILSRLTNRKFKSYQKENRSTKDQQYLDLLSDENFVNDFKQQNALDYSIYNHVIEQFKVWEKKYINK